MSFSTHLSTSSGATSGQVGRFIVPAQAIQSAISSHQHNSAQIALVAPGSEPTQLRMELQAAYSAYVSGQISDAEYDAVHSRIFKASNAYEGRVSDYKARTQAGQTSPGDFHKEFHGCTDEEAQDLLRYHSDLEKIRNANEVQSQTRMRQPSRYGRGH